MLGSGSRSDATPGGWWKIKRQPTALPDEQWSGPERAPRVLIECEDSSMIWAMERLLGDAGYEVAACVGPSAEATCALAAAGHCELQAGADVIINHLRPGADGVGDLVHATRAAYPDTPVVVSARAHLEADDLAYDGTVVLQEPWQSEALVAAVDELTGRSSRS